MNKVKLGAIAEIQAGPFGTQLHKNEYVSEGTPMINSKNIGHGEIIDNNFDFVPSSVCHRLPQYILKSGDIVFGRAGTIDRHAYVDEEYDGSFQGTNCIRIRCKEKKLSLYVSYYLWLRELKSKIENAAGGSIQAYITTDLLKNIDIQIPADYAEKAFVLRQIDQKIENNNRINDNLQRQLKLLYDYWFTQFDFPDETGRPYRTSGGKMQIDPTLRRPIPIGWEVKTLGDILVEKPKSDIQVGRAKTATGSFPFFTSGDTVLEWSEALVEGRNCFLNTGGNADVKFYVGAAAYSTDTWCVTGEKDFSDYLYLLLESMRPELHKKYFQGTGLKHLQKNLLKNREICIPPDAVLRAFNEQIQPMLTLISQNIRENKKLTDLRDWLLPLLMNGQATLAD